MTDKQGFVLAYRKAWYHPVFSNLLEGAIWNYLYQNAYWKDGEKNINGHVFSVKRGEVAVTISYLAKGFCTTEKGVRRVIQKLEKYGMVVTQGTSRGTVITICNYDKYQHSENAEGEPRANNGRTEGEPRGNNKKEGKNKRKKEVIIITDIPEGVSEQTWNDFQHLRKKKKADITQTVLDRIKKEALDAGWTLENALAECCVRGWQSFKAEWVSSKKADRPYMELTAREQAERNMIC